MQIELPEGMSLQIGDSIDLTIGGRHLLRAAVLAYGLPLITMLVSLLALQSFGVATDDASGVLAAVGGLLAGLVLGRALLKRESVCDQFVPTIGSSADGNAG